MLSELFNTGSVITHHSNSLNSSFVTVNIPGSARRTGISLVTRLEYPDTGNGKQDEKIKVSSYRPVLLFNHSPVFIIRVYHKQSAQRAKEKECLNHRSEIIAASLPEINEITADVAHRKERRHTPQRFGKLFGLYAHHSAENHASKVDKHAYRVRRAELFKDIR